MHISSLTPPRTSKKPSRGDYAPFHLTQASYLQRQQNAIKSAEIPGVGAAGHQQYHYRQAKRGDAMQYGHDTKPTTNTHRRPRTTIAMACAMLAALMGCESVIDASRDALAGPIVVAPPPQQLPPVESAGGSALLGGRQFAVNTPDEYWGIGYLNAPRRALTRVSLPLFTAPRADQWGWFIEGRGYDGTQDQAPPARPDMWLRLVNGEQALIVRRENRGWIEVQWGEPTDTRGGLAWTTIDLARQSGMIYTPWSSAFIGAGGMVFRDETTKYNIRTGPGTDALPITTLTGTGYDFDVETISGDWMRVTINQPARCAPPADGGGGEVLLGGPSSTPGLMGGPNDPLLPNLDGLGPTGDILGWIKWRDADKGPWIMQQNICVTTVTSSQGS